MIQNEISKLCIKETNKRKIQLPITEEDVKDGISLTSSSVALDLVLSYYKKHDKTMTNRIICLQVLFLST